MLDFEELVGRGAGFRTSAPIMLLVLSFRLLDCTKAWASVAQADQECAFSITYWVTRDEKTIVASLCE